MNNNTMLAVAIFMILYGLVFIGAGFLSLHYDMGWGDSFTNINYFNIENKKEFKAKINRLVGFIFIGLGLILIISAVLIIIL